MALTALSPSRTPSLERHVAQHAAQTERVLEGFDLGTGGPWRASEIEVRTESEGQLLAARTWR